MLDRVNQINQAFTKIFTSGMQSIKPKDETDPEYEKKLEKWQNAFQFPEKLKYFVNHLNNILVLAGPNAEILPPVEKDFSKYLNQVLNSHEWHEHMKLAEPNIPHNDPERDEKMEKWKKAFVYVDKVEAYSKDVEKEFEQKDTISRALYNTVLDHFIRKLE